MSYLEEKYIKHKYEPIHPSKDEWPVVKLARERKEFVKKVADLSEDRILNLTGNNADILKEELETTLYREKLRIKQNPWVVDPDDDSSFWSSVKSSLVQISTETANNKAKKFQAYKEILNSITARYAEEIASNFKTTHYKFTRSVVTYGFSRLLNAARVKGFRSIFSNQYTLQDKIQIKIVFVMSSTVIRYQYDTLWRNRFHHFHEVFRKGVEVPFDRRSNFRV